MWSLEFVDGTIKYENNYNYWDEVEDNEIKKAYFFINENKHLTFENFSSISIAKLGVLSFSGKNKHIGYVITEVKDNIGKFIQTTVRPDTVDTKEFPINQLTIPQHCFRKGTFN